MRLIMLSLLAFLLVAPVAAQEMPACLHAGVPFSSGDRICAPSRIASDGTDGVVLQCTVSGWQQAPISSTPKERCILPELTRTEIAVIVRAIIEEMNR